MSEAPRADMRPVRYITRANKAKLMKDLEDPAERELILREFDADVYSAGSEEVRGFQLGTWVEFHEAWHKGSVHPFPLTEAKIRVVAACFKRAGYRSFPNYLTRAKDEHINLGYPWNLQLDRAARRAARSVRRAIGPPKTAMAFSLVGLTPLLEAGCGLHCDDDEPLDPIAVMILLALFMLREIEGAALKVWHITLDHSARTVTILLSSSKTDIEARGVYRTWGCLCEHDHEAPCAYHAAAHHVKKLEEFFGELKKDLPFFATPSGQHPSKAGMVKALLRAARMTNQPTEKDGQAITGHSGRVSGAQFLAMIGVALILIKLLARWDSNAVEGYVRDAPLASMTKLTKIALHRNTDDDVITGGKLHEQGVKKMMEKWNAKLKAVKKDLMHLKALHLKDFGEHEDLNAEIQNDKKEMHDSRFLVAVINLENQKAHIEATMKSDGVPRTRCGWPFALSPHERASAHTKANGNRCDRCWRRVLHLGSTYSSGSESA